MTIPPRLVTFGHATDLTANLLKAGGCRPAMVPYSTFTNERPAIDPNGGGDIMDR
jgi:hypothetical protein